ncbi:hypothetical protein [Chitinophaga sp.]|nr:hypothetical protein [Chitinophaga sp.]
MKNDIINNIDNIDFKARAVLGRIIALVDIPFGQNYSFNWDNKYQ